MHIGFINTSCKENAKPFREVPFGPLYLLTILEQEFGDAHKYSFTDLRGLPEDHRRYHITEKDVFFHSVTSPQYAEILEIVRECRSLFPNAKHIAGGAHINYFPEECAQIFDAICIGEGEELIKQIIRDIECNKLQNVYRHTGKIDLDVYPYPRRHYLARAAVVDTGLMSRKYHDMPATSVLFSRGCQFHCHFCSILYMRRTQFRSPKLVAEEIDYLKREYGVQGLLLKDDQAISVNPREARPFLEVLGAANVKWRGVTRANGIHPDMVKLAKESGCIEVGVAIESVSQRALDIMEKNMRLDKAREYLDLLQQVGIDRKILLIIGLPGEPKDIAEQTINFIKEVKPSNVVLSMLTPMPGSEIYNNPQKFGIKINKSISFDKYMYARGRFDPNEKAEPLFEYDAMTPFGPGKSMEEIIDDHDTIQTFLRDNGYNF